MTKMTKYIIAGGLFILITAATVYLHIKEPLVDMVMTCRIELVENDRQLQNVNKHILLTDLTFQQRNVSFSYRYFTELGKPIATFHVQGEILKAQKVHGTYTLNILNSQLDIHDKSVDLPLHADHIKAFTDRNIEKQGVQNLTLKVIKEDKEQQLAFLYFLPSSNIAACHLTHLKE
ncbi:hypothetical protein [Shewanella sp. WPAGA9]|uniref:hypothetical protein n=1 Tax=Shewanella sp. ENK2 TaxID=2775245 RepID=UPI00177F0A37|nr:hypothetical protein [Shewanella sp. WPAGA9]